MEIERLSKFGASVSFLMMGLFSISATEVGGLMTPDDSILGICCRKVVTRWELWTVTGSSTRMSVYFKPDFKRLIYVLVLRQIMVDVGRAHFSVVNLFSL